jgi:hypothetical protein
MSRHTARVRAGNDRASLYTEITHKIIAELEAGRIPWVQPWGTAAIKAPLAMPRNASTQRGYSGINVLILWGAVIEHAIAGFSYWFRSGIAARTSNRHEIDAENQHGDRDRGRKQRLGTGLRDLDNLIAIDRAARAPKGEAASWCAGHVQ